MAHVNLLSVVVPMWNEEQNIRPTTTALREVCEALVEEGEIGAYEVVLVNDFSTDATGAIAESLAATWPEVRVVHHDRNRKLGAGIRSGITHARGDVLLYTDADLPCDPAELRRALRFLRIYQADVVSASRLSRTAEGLRRTALSWGYNTLVRTVFGLCVRDVNFAFKLFRRRVVDAYMPRSEGSFIDAELLVAADRLGFKVVQLSVDYVARLRGESTLSGLSVIATLLRELFALRPKLLSLHRLSPDALELPPEPRAVTWPTGRRPPAHVSSSSSSSSSSAMWP